MKAVQMFIFSDANNSTMFMGTEERFKEVYPDVPVIDMRGFCERMGWKMQVVMGLQGPEPPPPYQGCEQPEVQWACRIKDQKPLDQQKDYYDRLLAMESFWWWVKSLAILVIGFFLVMFLAKIAFMIIMIPVVLLMMAIGKLTGK